MLGQTPESLAPKELLENGIGRLGVGHGDLARQRPGQVGLGASSSGDPLQLRIQQNIHAAEEETGHGSHAIDRPAVPHPIFQYGEVGFRHFTVAGQAEQERDVNVDSQAEQMPDRLHAFPCTGHLYQEVGPVHRRRQPLGLGDRVRRVTRQVGGNLKAHVTIPALGAIIGRPQQIAGVLYVAHRQRLVNLLGREAFAGQLADLSVVVVAGRERLLEDGRIGGQAGNAVSSIHRCNWPERIKERLRRSSQTLWPKVGNRRSGFCGIESSSSRDICWQPGTGYGARLLADNRPPRSHGLLGKPFTAL